MAPLLEPPIRPQESYHESRFIPPNEIRAISLKTRRLRLMLGATAMLGLSALSPRFAMAQEAAPILAGSSSTTGGGLVRPTVIPPNLANFAGADFVDGLGPKVIMPDGTVLVLPAIPGVVITSDPAVPKITVTYNADGTKVVVFIDGEGGTSYTFDKKDGRWNYHVQGNNDTFDGKVTYTDGDFEAEAELRADDHSAEIILWGRHKF